MKIRSGIGVMCVLVAVVAISAGPATAAVTAKPAAKPITSPGIGKPSRCIGTKGCPVG